MAPLVNKKPNKTKQKKKKTDLLNNFKEVILLVSVVEKFIRKKAKKVSLIHTLRVNSQTLLPQSIKCLASCIANLLFSG